MLSLGQIALAEIDIGEPLVDDWIKGVSGSDPVSTIQNFIKVLFGFLGLVMVIIALWGGWKILTSWAQDEGREAGKKIIINAIIGVVVIFFAWTITSFVFSILSGDTISG